MDKVEIVLNIVAGLVVVSFIVFITYIITSTNASKTLMEVECKKTNYVYLKDNDRLPIYDCSIEEGEV